MNRRLWSFFLAFCILLTPLSALALSDAETVPELAEPVEDAETVPDAAGDMRSVTPPDRADAALMAGDFEIDADGTLTKYNGSGGDVVIPDGVTSIGAYAFSACSGLTSVAIPDSVTSIGNYAFSGCSGLTSVTIPDGVTSIGYAFHGCENLTEIVVGMDNPSFSSVDGVLFTKDEATLICYPSGKDTSYEIPDSVTSIGAYAFSACSGLTSVTIPDSVTYIDRGAFNGCDALTDVYYSGGEAEWAAIDIGVYNDRLKNAKIHYNSAGSEVVASGECGDNLTWTLDGDGVLLIKGTGDMSNYTSAKPAPWADYRADIKTVRIDDGVTSVGNCAFQDCAALTAVTIPGGVTKIGESAFSGCTTLPGVALPGDLTSIGKAAFKGCGALTAVAIPAAVTTIGEETFYNCAALTEITIPDSVTSLGESAFGGCAALTSAAIGKGVTEIGRSVFGGSGLTSVVIPDSVTSLDKYAFYNCTALTSVTIPVSVTNITENAFEGCTALADVYYGGTAKQWKAIAIGANNEPLTNAKIHYDGVDGYDSLKDMDLSGKFINLILVVDTTGSMGDVIWSVQNTLKTFVYTLSETGARLRIALIDYKDIEEDGDDSTVLHHLGDSYWYENTDIDALVEEISNLRADGGGDDPESVVDAYGNVVKTDITEGMSFNANAAKFSFLLTDADYKTENNYGIKDMDDLIERLNKVVVRKDGTTEGVATSVITYTSYFNAYKDLTEKTGGICINLSGDFEEAMETFAAEIALAAADYVEEEDVVRVEGISFAGDVAVPLGRVRNFAPTFKPLNASDQKVDWTVEDESVLSARNKAASLRLVVQADKVGESRIVARTVDGGYAANFTLSVPGDVVVTDGVLETCDIGRLLDYAKDPDGTTALVYYNDASREESVSEATQAQIYAAVAESGQSVRFVFDDEIGYPQYSWSFDGGRMEHADKTFNMGISKGNDAAVKELAYYSLAQYRLLDFSHEGALPGEAAVCVAVNLPDGDYNLYFYDADNDALKESAPVSVTDGMASFSLSETGKHAVIGESVRKYAVVLKALDAEDETAVPNAVFSLTDSLGVKAEFAAKEDGAASARVKSGAYSVSIRADGYHDKSEDMEVTDDGTFSFYLSRMETSDTQAPAAKLSPMEITVPVNTAVVFDAAESTDDVGIVDYAWAFGDDSTASGAEDSVSHAFAAEGTYTVTLTVKDVGGNSASAAATVTVISADSAVQVTALDTVSGKPVAGAKISVADSAYVTGADGKAFLPSENGTYAVSVSADGYQDRVFSMQVTDEHRAFTVYLNASDILRVETKVKEMTKEEAVAAGIDVDAPENQHVYKSTAVFEFGELTYIHNDSAVLDYTPLKTGKITAYPVARDIFLIVYSQVNWLKELFRVQLYVQNTSNFERVEDCSANLTLPEGLSLAVMTEDKDPQSLEVALGTIAPGSEIGHNWYLCGDVAGEYALSGKVTGVRVNADDTIREDTSADFATSEKISVLAGDAMTLNITAEKYGVVGVPYHVTYELENVSEKTLYDVRLSVMGGKFVEDYDASDLEYDPGEAASGSLTTGFSLYTETFKPGDKLKGVFTITFGKGLDIRRGMEYVLKEMFSVTGAESTTEIPTTFTLTNNERILLSYDANGGGGEMEAQLLEKDADEPSFSYTFPECAFAEPAEKYFKAWLFDGTEYAPGDQCVLTEDATLLAAWEDDVYVEGAERKVKFDLAGGDGALDAITVIAGQTYGELPAPTRTGYAFDGWHTAAEGGEEVKSSDTAMLSRDVRLYAHWTPLSYAIRWLNDDGSELRTDSVPYGETPVYGGETPQKADDEQFSYTFSGWTPEIEPVSGEATYTASYDSISNFFTITWLNYNGETLKKDDRVPRGQIPVYDGSVPERTPVGATAYVFSEWRPKVEPVTADAFYIAVYESVPRTHTITWVNEDGTILETDKNVPYGETPAYDGETPTKEPDVQYTYAFSGWTKTVRPVKEDTTYTAAYSRTLRTYTVIWANEDGTTLKTDENIPYGQAPSYSGETPTKEANDGEKYVFTKWAPEIAPVSGDITYTATYRLASASYIEGVSVSGETVTATLDCSEVGAVALCAVYSENGQIIALESLPASSDRRVYSFEFKGYAFDYAKAFLISGDMRSLCASAESQ